MSELSRDIRYGFKMLARNPMVSALAILSLALGIGANTTIFSLVNDILLRPLPAEEPERLVTMYSKWENDERYTSISYPDFEDYRDRNQVLTGLSVTNYMPMGIKGADRPEMVLGQIVSHNYFDLLGVNPILGRGFLPEEGKTEGTHPVVVISHSTWQKRFGGEPDIIGKEILVNSRQFEVVGVAPPTYRSLHVGIAPEVWVPIMMQGTIFPQMSLEHRGNHYLQMFGRLKPGVSIEQASDNLKAIAAQLGEEYPDNNKRKSVVMVETNRDRTFLALMDDGVLKLFMGVLMVVVGLVLLIACSNVANLLLARAMGRQKEMAVRVSMGAGRGRILRQMFTESALLALIAGAAGLGISVYATSLIQAFEPPIGIPIVMDLEPDWRVLAFTFGTAVLTGLLFGLAPALQTFRADMFAALKSQRTSLQNSVRKSRLQSSLVVAQVALSLFLLIVAGLCVRSLQNATVLDVGFNPDDALTVTVDTNMGRYDEAEGMIFFDRVAEQISAIPGVKAAGMISWIPLGLGGSDSGVRIPGYEPAERERMSLYNASVVGDYFEAMEIPMLEGRVFDDRDTADSTKVSVINEVMARRYWKGESPIGRTFRSNGEDWQVIGVVKSGKARKLTEAPEPFFYKAASQDYQTSHALIVRGNIDSASIAGPVLQELSRIDPTLPFSDLRTLHQHLGLMLLPSKFLGVLMGTFGALAAGTGSGGSLRRNGAFGEPADPGVRRPRGTGRPARRAHRAGAAPRAGDHGHRVGLWPDCCRGGDPGPPGSSTRHFLT